MVGMNQDDHSLEEGDVLGDNSDVEDSEMSQGLVEEELLQEEVERDEQTPGGGDCAEVGKKGDAYEEIMKHYLYNQEKMEVKENPYTQEKMEAKAKLLYSENECDLLEPVRYFRRMLSVRNPPISDFIDLNILPRFVQLLSCAKDPALCVGLLGCYRTICSNLNMKSCISFVSMRCYGLLLTLPVEIASILNRLLMLEQYLL